jgi:hypothetical protein
MWRSFAWNLDFHADNGKASKWKIFITKLKPVKDNKGLIKTEILNFLAKFLKSQRTKVVSKVSNNSTHHWKKQQVCSVPQNVDTKATEVSWHVFEISLRENLFSITCSEKLKKSQICPLWFFKNSSIRKLNWGYIEKLDQNDF